VLRRGMSRSKPTSRLSRTPSGMIGQENNDARKRTYDIEKRKRSVRDISIFSN
jgi:hypothetical protein